jgi:hypothetical protein
LAEELAGGDMHYIASRDTRAASRDRVFDIASRHDKRDGPI